MLTSVLLVLALMHLQAQREYLPTPEDLEQFHRSKTYVVLNSNPLSDYNIEVQDAVKKFWNITEYEFLPFSQFGEKSADPGASFLYMAAVNFEKDKTDTRYTFLCLSLGGDYESIDDMKDVANLPLGYYGVDEDSYAYKLGTLVRFLQDHVRLITEHPEMVSQNVYKHYNDNMGGMKDKVLYVVEDELESQVSTLARIHKVYPYEVQIVDRERIKELIMAEQENAVFLHKVGPQGRQENARVYKILIGAADGKFYYFDYHKVSARNPDAFLESDFVKLARANP
jgi:hypothetical protein